MKIVGTCTYKGTNYYGWQKQVGFKSVQSTIEEVLSKIYDTTVNIVGSGRTDAGVHALKQYFHFIVEKNKDLKQLMYAMNKMLPDDIQILSLDLADDDFHARYNARKKIYEYRIMLKNKDVFNYDLAYLYPMDLDFNLLEESLKMFEGKHCFKDFTSKEEDESGFIREIYKIKVNKDGNDISIRFEGNGFMRYQIRNMVGTAIAIASKKEDIQFIKNHLQGNKNREIVAYKAPAVGLYLVDVIY